MLVLKTEGHQKQINLLPRLFPPLKKERGYEDYLKLWVLKQEGHQKQKQNQPPTQSLFSPEERAGVRDWIKMIIMLVFNRHVDNVYYQ